MQQLGIIKKCLLGVFEEFSKTNANIFIHSSSTVYINVAFFASRRIRRIFFEALFIQRNGNEEGKDDEFPKLT